MSTLHRARRIEILLNELRYERHVRRALLSELVDELEQLECELPAQCAASAARSLLGRVDAGDANDFEQLLERVASSGGAGPERDDHGDPVAPEMTPRRQLCNGTTPPPLGRRRLSM